MDDPENSVTGSIDVLRLRSILRGMRSRKQSVRDWALEEAKRLDAPQETQLAEMVERSFTEEAGRRRFWRFTAFYASPIAVGLVVSCLRRWVPGFPSGLGDLIELFGWIWLWHVTDRAAKRAFVLPEDGRTEWQKHRQPDGRQTQAAESAEADLREDLQFPPLLRLNPQTQAAENIETDLREPPAAAQALVQGLTDVHASVRDVAQQKAAYLSSEDLLAAARLVMQSYEQRHDRENRKRSRFSNAAFWVFVAGAFTSFPYWYLVMFALGLYAFYYRDSAVRRYLDALAILLEELTTRRGIPVSLDRLTARSDSVVADRMKLRCPALNRFLQITTPTQDTATPLSEEEKEALKALSAEVLLSSFENVEDTLAALKRLEEIGDETIVATVQRLATMPDRKIVGVVFASARTPLRTVTEYRRDAQRIREAAQSCLAALNARADVQQRMLLRGSSAAAPAEALLRAAAGPVDHRPDELLRASGDEARIVAPGVTVAPRDRVGEEALVQAVQQNGV